MQEVEESVDDFKRHVLDIEASVKTLVTEEEKEQLPAWYERWLPFRRASKVVPLSEQAEKPDARLQQET